MRFGTVSLGLVLGIFALGGTSSCDSDDPALTAVEGCAGAARLYCEKFSSCSPLRFPEIYATVADCERVSAGWCETELATPDVAVTPEARLACAEADSAQTCDDWFVVVPSACVLPPGPRGEGVACSWPSQCSTGLCWGFGGLPCGKCRSPIALGEACDGNLPCEGNLYCTGDEIAPGTCVEQAKIGDACLDQPCDWGYQGLCINGTCTKAAQLDEPCGADRDCGWWLYCDYLTATCKANPIMKLGESCFAPGDGSEPRCGPGTDCDDSGICVPRSKFGEPCATVACESGLACINGTCLKYDVNACPVQGPEQGPVQDSTESSALGNSLSSTEGRTPPADARWPHSLARSRDPAVR